jgi:hypothetical protein
MGYLVHAAGITVSSGAQSTGLALIHKPGDALNQT